MGLLRSLCDLLPSFAQSYFQEAFLSIALMTLHCFAGKGRREKEIERHTHTQSKERKLGESVSLVNFNQHLLMTAFYVVKLNEEVYSPFFIPWGFS